MNSVTYATYAKIFANHPFRNEILKDEILCRLMTNSIQWSDLCTEDEPKSVYNPVYKPIETIRKPRVTWGLPTVVPVAPVVSTVVPVVSTVVPMAPLAPIPKLVWKPVSNVPKSIKTIIVNNIPRTITKDDLTEIFKEFGPVQGVHIPKNTDKNSPYYGTLRGFAMVQFTDAHIAQKTQMMCTLEPFYVYNNIVSVQMAKEDRVIYNV